MDAAPFTLENTTDAPAAFHAAPCSVTATGRCDTIRELMDDVCETSRQLEITTGHLAMLRESLKNPVMTHAMMLRGEIGYTPEHLRHILGDSLHNSQDMSPR
jgi:hypothetical protein